MTRVIVGDWNRAGNTIGFSCLKCGTWLKVYAGFVDDKGRTDGAITCTSRSCDWSEMVAFYNYKPKGLPIAPS
jgi:hypothetical protein